MRKNRGIPWHVPSRRLLPLSLLPFFLSLYKEKRSKFKKCIFIKKKKIKRHIFIKGILKDASFNEEKTKKFISRKDQKIFFLIHPL